jgi:hypothetical protein
MKKYNFKVGDYVISKNDSYFYTKNKPYKILNIVYGLNFILNNDTSDILFYDIESNIEVDVEWSSDEFDDFFYSPQEFRKEKLKILFNKQ